MAVTDVPLTLGVAVTLALLVRGQLLPAGIAIGLTASFKYPGFVLLVPLIVAGWGQRRRPAVAAAVAPPAFLAASPYFAVHLGAALDDVLRVQRGVRGGWLGFESDRWAPIAFSTGSGRESAQRSWSHLAASSWRSCTGRSPTACSRPSWSHTFLTLMPLDAHFDRYVLPLVPALGALAGRF
jgi:hypothetical protein